MSKKSIWIVLLNTSLLFSMAIDEIKDIKEKIPSLQKLCLYTIFGSMEDYIENYALIDPSATKNCIKKIGLKNPVDFMKEHAQEIEKRTAFYCRFLEEDVKAISADGSFLLVQRFGRWKSVDVYDGRLMKRNQKKKPIGSIPLEKEGQIIKAAFSFDNKKVALAFQDWIDNTHFGTRIEIYPLCCKEQQTIKSQFFPHEYLNDFIFYNYNLVIPRAQEMTVWNFLNGSLRKFSFKSKCSLIKAKHNKICMFREDFVVSRVCGDTHSIVIFTNEGIIKKKLFGHGDIANALSCHDQTSRLISGSADKTVRIWDLQKPKGEECIALLHHPGSVSSVLFDDFGQKAFTGTGSLDHTLRIWDIALKQLLYKYEFSHFRSIRDVQWGKNSIIIADNDGNCYKFKKSILPLVFKENREKNHD